MTEPRISAPPPPPPMSSISIWENLELVDRVVLSDLESYVRLIDFCITQLKAQGPSRFCKESNEEEVRPAAKREGISHKVSRTVT